MAVLGGNFSARPGGAPWTPATAVVRYFVIDTGGEDDFYENICGVLDVTAPGGDTYPVRGIFNGSTELVPLVGPGASLPVKVDPDEPGRVAIDWEEFESSADQTVDRAAVIRANHEAHAADGAG